MTDNVKKPQDKMPKRRNKKEPKVVSFEVEGFDGEFEAPDLNTIPLKVQRHLMKGDMNLLIEALGDYGEVVDDMDGTEVEDFLEAWTKASGVDLKN